MKDYGNAIKILRKRNQMTQTTLAERLNISGQAVSKWENNLAQPDFDTILKLTEIFNISLDEFSKLCSFGEAEATPAPDEAAATEAAPAPAPAPAPMLIGVCAHCGRSIYEEKAIGARIPRLLCTKCKTAIDRRKQEEANRKAAEARRLEEEARIAYQKQVIAFRRSMTTPAIVIGILGLPLAIINPFFLLVAVFAYLVTVQIKWDDNLVTSIFDSTFGKTFAQPGLIIPLSLDGFVWAFCVKVAMTVIWFLLSCLVTLFGLLLCAVIAPFAFPFSLQKSIQAMRRGQFQ